MEPRRALEALGPEAARVAGWPAGLAAGTIERVPTAALRADLRGRAVLRRGIAARLDVPAPTPEAARRSVQPLVDLARGAHLAAVPDVRDIFVLRQLAASSTDPTGRAELAAAEARLLLVFGQPAAAGACLAAASGGGAAGEALLAAARSGKLHEATELRAQVQRMLRDPKAARFAEAFPRDWLQLRSVGMFPPDKKLYPDYDAYLEKCFIGETTAFFREVLTKNLSLREFLDSNWTMVNARLAEHYKLPELAGDEFRRVALRPEDNRGGLLTHAAILSLTSDGTRHRPVHRGKWVLESILGKSPPPPPANVPAIEPTPATQPKATLRNKLDAHKRNESCAACHAKIDPLGLAFDHYDAIGRWRTEEVVGDGSGANPKVDASGELVDGRKFSDAVGFRKLLVEDLDKFNAAFAEKLATFALRRVMTVDDRDALASLAQRSKAADYRLPAIVEALVLSDFFQKR